MVLLRLNTEDGKDGTKFARDFAVNSLPTFLVLNKDLMIAGIIKGYAPAKEFAASLGDAEVKYNDFMKRANDEASISKDYAKRLALAKEFESRAAYAQSETRLKKLVAEPGIPANVRDDSYFELALTQILQKKFVDAKSDPRQIRDAAEQGRRLRALAPAHRRHLPADRQRSGGARVSTRRSRRSTRTPRTTGNINMMIPKLERQIGGPRKQ